MRVFFAGTYQGPIKKVREKILAEAKPLYFLETFFNGEKTCAQVLKDAGKENFLLDSGAFSFMSGAECSKERLEEYMDRYIAFINKYDVRYFFELDVDTIFGIEFVEKLRSRLEKQTGKKCIPVWHKGRGIEYFKKMVEEYDYIAIGGLVFHVKPSEYELIRKMVSYAKMKGVKVHGLGFTKTRELEKYKFYSVDSCSWAKSAVFGGTLQVFNGKYIENRRLDPRYKKNLQKVAIFNWKEWVKYQKYMDKKGF